MKTVSDFEDFIFPYTPDAPTAIIHHAVMESITRFMQETKVAKDLVKVPLFANTPDYLIDVPECRTIMEVVRVRYGDGSGLPNQDSDELVRGVDYTVDLLGQPMIELTDPPRSRCDDDITDVLWIEYAWSISRDGCEIPDFIYERYMPEIKDGALAELYAIPGQDWSNVQYAVMLRNNLEEKYKTIRSKFDTRWGRQPMKMRRAIVHPRGFSKFWRG